jgi:hypothetical protein
MVVSACAEYKEENMVSSFVARDLLSYVTAWMKKL